MQPKIALQLWSVQEEMGHDFLGTLKQVKDMGYDGVEFAGYEDVELNHLVSALKEMNLEVVGSHISTEALGHDLSQIITFEKAIGNERVVCPYAKFETLDEWKKFFKEMNQLQKVLAKENLKLLYHNHSHEFTDIPNINILDEMILAIPNIRLEVDTYWIHYAGEKVVEWLEMHRSYIELIHIKDMCIVESGKESTEIGTGILPIRQYVEWAKDAHIPWLVVEQEAFSKYSPLVSASKNILGLRKIIEEVYT